MTFVIFLCLCVHLSSLSLWLIKRRLMITTICTSNTVLDNIILSNILLIPLYCPCFRSDHFSLSPITSKSSKQMTFCNLTRLWDHVNLFRYAIFITMFSFIIKASDNFWSKQYMIWKDSVVHAPWWE